MNKLNRKTALAITILLLTLPRLAFAADKDIDEIYTTLGHFYQNIILRVGTTLAGFVIMFGGIVYSTSGGDPTKAGRGKELIYGAISGLVLLVLAAFIVRMITT